MTASASRQTRQDTGIVARRIVLSGQVQGVGFRPFIYRLATHYRLAGWVKNCVGTVEILIQGERSDVNHFQRDIFTQKPPLAKPALVSESETPAAETTTAAFTILPSQREGDAVIRVPADLFLCDDCLRELNDPADRRYRYPFINCTQCGPRYTLIRRLPYDRANTTMASFSLCTDCLAEYNDPANRRFHAEPVACPACGPVLRYRDGDREICDNEVALTRAVERLHNGGIVAVKGIGGYHLVCDAGSEAAVERLRRKKQRPHKPLAVMFPAPVQAPLANVEQNVLLSEEDRRFLLQAARPILLLQKRPASQLCDAIAPGLNEVGVMLPYSPLHHLLLNAFGGALVATSANISGEPVLIDNDEVETRLAQVADAFLHHNRSIQRPADDPVYRRIAQRPRPLRLGRGAAPLELALPFELAQPVLAVGAHMKNTITLAWGNRAVVSPHIGEMDSARTMAVFENIINDLEELYKVEYREIICDAHPSYRSTRWAQQQARRQHIPLRRVYHHHAHAAAASVECWSDIEHDEALLAFTWDGVGYGEDGSLWGGEALLGRPGQWRRVATMQPFYLPGGERAGREPWRSAAALCWETGIAYSAMPADNGLLQQAWQRKINAPKTTSVGRLFDAAAALSGVLQQASFEGQAPMVFEALAGYTENFVEMELINDNNLLITNWSALVSVMQDTAISQAERASLFHASMARALLQQARVIRSGHEVDTVCLCGGVFQNRLLTQQVIALLEADGFRVRLPELIPVNDAGISFGQIIEYAGLAARRDSQP